MERKLRVAILQQDDWEIRQNSTHVLANALYTNSSSLAYQSRLTVPADGPPARITWSSGTSKCETYNIISPRLASGLNVYTIFPPKHAKVVSNPLYSTQHAGREKLEDFLQLYLPTDIEYVKGTLDHCDLDIDVQSDITVISSYCCLPAGNQFVTSQPSQVDKLELGVFEIETEDERDVNLGGFRCTWNAETGEIQKCLPTSISYHPSHVKQKSNLGITMWLEEPIALHPKILIDLSNAKPRETCDYVFYSQLPSEIFVDKFRSSPLLLYGEHDLELPAYKLDNTTWGSEVLFRLTPGEVNEIVLHSRYTAPLITGKSDHFSVEFQPLVFLACDTKDDELFTNLFYSKGLGYESLFTNDTLFVHLNSTKLIVDIPRPSLNDYKAIEVITLLCMVSSLVYLVRKIFTNSRSTSGKISPTGNI